MSNSSKSRLFGVLYFLLLLTVLAQTLVNRAGQVTFSSLEGTPVKPLSSISRSSQPPVLIQGFVCNPCGVKRVHAPSITTTVDGTVQTVWYGGTREGAKDVSIYRSIYLPKNLFWTPADVLIDRSESMEKLSRYIKKLGNPAIAIDNNRLWLFFVTVAAGGWSGSSISYLRSEDDGESWQTAGRIISSPFFNISTLVRTNPISLPKGIVAIPAYHELAGKFSEFIYLSSEGEVLDKSRISWGRTTLQPAVISLDGDILIAYMRNAATHRRKIAKATSLDNGKSWGKLHYLSLPNPDASVAALKDNQGRIIVALNNTTEGRRDMSLAVSLDNGSSRMVVHRFDYSEKDGAEFSYPSLIQATDGTYHLVYTWHRKRIKHVSFNQAWLDQRIAEADEKQ